jgi:beta-N-acetylhexosaminidase
MDATNAPVGTGEEHAPNLTLDDAIGQCLMAGFDGYEPTPGIVDLIERRRVGGVILFTRNCRDAAQILDLTSRLQTIARAAGHPAPLLIGIDQENGLVRRLGPDAASFPGNMALGAADAEDLTEAVAAATGAELRAVGVNLNLAPVADVNNNPSNPVIGVRSFGADPTLVARHVAAAVRGYRRAGAIPTLKHFPGHGDTATDSHLALPLVPDDRARLEAVELPPFRAGIAAGAECVMTAHVALPRLTGGRPTPSTLAPEIVNGLLRAELGYHGAVITDCLEMDAVAEGVGVAAGAVAALRAGNDLVLVSHRLERQTAALDALRAAAEEDGALRASVLRGAGRVLALKRRHLSWEALPERAGLHVVGSQAHRRLSEDAYARIVTVMRDEAGLLPLNLSAAERIVVVAYDRGPTSAAVDLPYAPQLVAEEARRVRGGIVGQTLLSPHATVEQREQARKAANDAAVVLLVTLNARRDEAQRAALREAIAGARRVIGVAVGDPYDAAALPEVGTYLACYEYAPEALRATVRVLFGQRQATGRAPIRLR